MKQHNWSGWPGAICTECFAEDQLELCVLTHDESLQCVFGHPMCELGHPANKCAEHVNTTCPGKWTSQVPVVAVVNVGISNDSKTGDPT